MNEEWRTNSFCVSSTDSGRFTEIGEFQDLDEETEYSHKQRGTFANRRKSLANSAAIGVFLRNLKPVPNDPFIDPIFSTCFNCWQFGHGYRNCYLPSQHRFCVNCGRMNVLIDSCPRCGRAYHHYIYMKEAKLKKQKPVNSFNYYFDYDFYNKEVVDNITQYETKESHSENCSFSKTSIPNLSEDEYYHSSDERENYSDGVFVDEDIKSHEPVSQLLCDFLKLLNDVKHWPMEVQNTLLLHFAMERRNQPQ